MLLTQSQNFAVQQVLKRQPKKKAERTNQNQENQDSEGPVDDVFSPAPTAFIVVLLQSVAAIWTFSILEY